MAKRVTFEVNTTGTVNSMYLWVEEKNVTLRNNKGYLMLEPRAQEYDLVYLAKGQKNATVEIVTESDEVQLSKKKSKIGSRRLTNGIDHFTVQI